MIERFKGYFDKDEDIEEEDYEEDEDEESEPEDDRYDFGYRTESSDEEDTLGDLEGAIAKDRNKKLTVVLIAPETFNDSVRISDELKKHHMVIVNLEDMEFEEAQKILDFVSGTVYALGGSINKVSGKIFTFSPVFVEVMNTLPIRRNIKGMDVPRFSGI